MGDASIQLASPLFPSATDRLAEAVAKCLCRHKSIGLFRWRGRLNPFADVGAVEVVETLGRRCMDCRSGTSAIRIGTWRLRSGPDRHV
jgi:hypothetical protein